MAAIEPEDDSELRARALLEREFRFELCRVAPGNRPTVDYRSPNGRAGVEVKRLTVAEYIGLAAQLEHTETFNSDILSGRWAVLIDAPTLSTTLSPMPQFPQDDLEEIARQEALGGRVMRKAEREEQWRAARFHETRPNIRLMRLGKDLEKHLAVLEQHNLNSTRGKYPPAHPPELARALREINRLTNVGTCLRAAAPAGLPGGVDVMLGSGYVRTDNADTVADRIAQWLENPKNDNVLKSLANEPEGTERHAVLVFDGTEPEQMAAIEQGTSFCPTLALALPEEIDVLWFILGPVACRYSSATQWSAVGTPDVGNWR